MDGLLVIFILFLAGIATSVFTAITLFMSMGRRRKSIMLLLKICIGLNMFWLIAVMLGNGDRSESGLFIMFAVVCMLFLSYFALKRQQRLP